MHTHEHTHAYTHMHTHTHAQAHTRTCTHTASSLLSFSSESVMENNKGLPHRCSVRLQGLKWPLNELVQKTTRN